MTSRAGMDGLLLWVGFLISCTLTVTAQNSGDTILCDIAELNLVARKLVAYPLDCRRYVDCVLSADEAYYTAHTLICPWGTFFNGDAVEPGCDFPFNFECPNDICRVGNIFAYSYADEGCKEYWFCTNGTTQGKQCCGEGLGFDGVVGCQSSRLTMCEDPCEKNDTLPDVGREANCTLIPHELDRKQYIELMPDGGNLTRDCAPGAMYSLSTCRCSDLDLLALLFPIMECHESLILNFAGFNGDGLPVIEDTSGQGIYIEKIQTRAIVIPTPTDDRAAYFMGIVGQGLIIPRFTSAYFDDVTIRVIFKLDLDALQPMGLEALVTNGGCRGKPASLSLNVDRLSTTQATIIGHVSTRLPEEVELRDETNIIMNGWNDVTLTWDQEMLSLTVNGNTMESDPSGNDKPLDSVNCALHIGMAPGEESLRGWIDMVSITLC